MKSKLDSDNPRCEGFKPDGTRCSVPALPGSKFCVFHDPERAEQRRAAQSRGGKANRIKTLGPDAPDLKVQDSQDVKELLSQTIDQVRKGQIDPRVGYAIAYLSNLMLKASEKNELETRLAELEKMVKAKQEDDTSDELELTEDSHE